MRGSMNTSVRRTPDGIAVTLGKRDGHLGMSTIIDLDQAVMLYEILGQVLADDFTEAHYQEWLARQAFDADGQLDQGGEVIPMHTMEDDFA